MTTNSRTHSFADLLQDTETKPCIALLGAGGKTTLLHRIGSEFAKQGQSVLLTALTRMLPQQHESFITIEELNQSNLRELKSRINPLFLLGSATEEEKYTGVSAAQLEQLVPEFDVCVIECDGARELPLKAHLQHDPLVPGFCTQAIIIVGADVVGTRIQDGFVHRPDRFCKKWSVTPNHVLDPAFVAKVITSKHGYREKVPDPIPISYLVNKAELFMEGAEKLASTLIDNTNSPVWISSLHEGWLERFDG